MSRPLQSVAALWQPIPLARRLTCCSRACCSNTASPELAAQHCQQVIELEPQRAEGYFALGRAFARQRRNDEAEAAYRQAIRLDSSRAATYHQLAVVLIDDDRYAAAGDALQKALSLQPESPIMQYSLGMICERQGQYKAAIAHWQQAAQLDSSYAQAHYQLGQIFAKIGRGQEAEASLRAALRQQPRPRQGAHCAGSGAAATGATRRRRGHLAASHCVRPL